MEEDREAGRSLMKKERSTEPGMNPYWTQKERLWQEPLPKGRVEFNEKSKEGGQQK